MVVKGAGSEVTAAGDGGHLDPEKPFIAKLLAGGFDKEFFPFSEGLFPAASCFDHVCCLLSLIRLSSSLWVSKD